jgi:hypothetical protein
MVYYPVHQATMHGEELGTGLQPCPTCACYPVPRSRKSAAVKAMRKPDAIHRKGADLAAGQRPAIPCGLLHWGKVTMNCWRRQFTRRP